MSRDLDLLARGADPRSRVPIPATGSRCPRHHGRAGEPRPCLLCRPDLVPVDLGGSLGLPRIAPARIRAALLYPATSQPRDLSRYPTRT